MAKVEKLLIIGIIVGLIVGLTIGVSGNLLTVGQGAGPLGPWDEKEPFVHCDDTDGGIWYDQIYIKGTVFEKIGDIVNEYVDYCIGEENHVITLAEESTGYLWVSGIIHEINNIVVSSDTSAYVRVDTDSKYVYEHHIYTFDAEPDPLDLFVIDVTVADNTTINESKVTLLLDEEIKRLEVIEHQTKQVELVDVTHTVTADLVADNTMGWLTVDGEIKIVTDGGIYVFNGDKGSVDVYVIDVFSDPQVIKKYIDIAIGASNQNILLEQYCDEVIHKEMAINCLENFNNETNTTKCFDGACV